jgi:hypothetical protein
MELHLRLRPRKRGGALERRRIAILVGDGNRGVAGRGHECREHDADTLARVQAHAASKAEDGI